MKTQYQINILDAQGNLIIEDLPHVEGKTKFKRTMYVNNQYETGSFDVNLIPIEERPQYKDTYDLLKPWQRVEMFRKGGELESAKSQSIKPSLSFDGSDDYILFNSSSDVEISNSFAVIADIYVEQNTGTYQIIINKGATGSTLPTNQNYNIYVDANMNIRLFWETGAGTGHDHICPFVLKEKTWYRVIGSYDHINQYVSIYINGEREYHEVETNVPVSNDSPITIGIEYDKTTLPFNGKISKVMLYSRYINLFEASEMNFDRYSNTDLKFLIDFNEGQGVTTTETINNLVGTFGEGDSDKYPSWTTSPNPVLIVQDEPVFTGFILNTPSNSNNWRISGIDSLARLKTVRCLPNEEQFSGVISDIILRTLKRREIELREKPTDFTRWNVSSGIAIDSSGEGVNIPITNIANGLKTIALK